LTATVAARSTRHTMTEQAQGLRACGQCWADRLGVDDDSARQRLRATGGLASLKVKKTHHSRAVVRHDVRAVGLVRKAAAFWTGAFPRPLPALTQTPATCSPIQCISSTAFHNADRGVRCDSAAVVRDCEGPKPAHAFAAHRPCSCQSLAYPAEREGQVQKRCGPARCQRVCRRSNSPACLAAGARTLNLRGASTSRSCTHCDRLHLEIRGRDCCKTWSNWQTVLVTCQQCLPGQRPRTYTCSTSLSWSQSAASGEQQATVPSLLQRLHLARSPMPAAARLCARRAVAEVRQRLRCGAWGAGCGAAARQRSCLSDG